jgi:hypothetical protein
MTVRMLHTVCANGHLVLVEEDVTKCPMCDVPIRDMSAEGPSMDPMTGHVIFAVGYTSGGAQ